MKTSMTQISQHSHRSAVLITGAAGGLGKAFAVEAASRGWNLFLTDLRREPLELLANSLRATYAVQVHTQACDLTDSLARAELFRTIETDGLRFWGLINVAGVDFEGPFFEQSCQQICTIVRLNIEGTLEMIHRTLPLRDPDVPLRIINVVSLAAFYPMPVKATYAASKRFLLDFSLALRNELEGMDVSVTALCPAGLPTTRECIQAIDSQGWLGQWTTQNIGDVADQTLNAALRGEAVYIPGFINRLMQALGSLIPTAWVVQLLGSRWKAAHQRTARALASHS